MVVQSISLVTDLRTQNRNIGVLYIASGQVTPGDSYGGMYLWEAASTVPDDGFYSLQVTGVSVGRWIRIGAASNIYTADGTLLNTRTLTLGGYTLNIAGSLFTTTFNIDGTVSFGSLVGVGSRYVVAGPTGVLGTAGTIPGPGTPTRFIESFTASSGQTTFNTANTLYASFFDVYLNGVLLDLASYTASANEIVLNEPCIIDDIIEVLGFINITYVGTIPSQVGQAGKFLSTDGTSLLWSSNPLGTVTSVDMSVPTGFDISGNPITTYGTLALSFASGYSLPSNTKQGQWDTAYNRSLTSAAVSGTTTKTLTLNKQDGGTITATWSDYDTQGVTNVSVSTGSAGTDLNASVLNPTTTPAITINLPDSSATSRGALTSTDWSTFNAKQATVTLTTTGSSGAATFISNTLNIPEYTLSGLGGVPSTRTLTINGTTYDLSANRTWSVGTVTSVDLSVPTGLAISGNPVTGSGTLAITYASGYAIPTTASQSNWDSAYSWVSAFPSLSGNTGKFLSNDGTSLNWQTVDLSSRVPTSRTLTINGVTYDLSADRTWTIVAGVSSVSGTAPISAVNVSGAVTISISQSGVSTDGYLSSTDWNTFNNKQAALTFGNLTEATSSVLTISGGTGAVIGSGTTIQVKQASASLSGFLSSTDWSTFNNKQDAITLTTTGSSGSATFVSNTLNIPTYTLSGLGGVPTTRQLTINGTAYDLSADRSWSVGTVTSVGLSMPGAFTVTSSPVTGSGTIAVTGAGTTSQYIRGDGTLADFPSGGGGGGSSVSYYLNGSVNQGTFGGNTYYEMNKNAIIGSGTDFNIGANGYIAQFLTDAGDPALLNIPAGNWNLEFYFSASSAGGSPSFHVELYKYDGTTFTLIASNVGFPELIAFGTTINPYFSTLSVPTTSLTLTDRLAIRIYVITSGRTITLHTEDNHLCQIITTFTTGLTALNGLTAQVQYFSTGTTGSDFNIDSATATHTFNLPVASATNTGKLSNTDWSTFNNKQTALTFGNLTESTSSVLTISGGTGAVIGSGTSIQVKQASGSQSGFLSSTDWTTFNNKFDNPMTTLGDIIYGGVSGAGTRLSGNTTTAKQYLSQTGTGSASAAPIWATISGSDITGAALTSTDDTNVTLTLGGSASTSLLRAASLTLGWTGQLSVSRGGTGASTLTGILVGNGSSAVTDVAGTAGQLLRRNAGNTAYEFFTPSYISAAITSLNGLTASTQTFVNDTNVTITSATSTHTLGWSGQLSIARGGTGASTASAAFDALSPMTTLGDVIYGGASGAGTRLAGNTTTTKQYLSQTGTGSASAAPVWSNFVADVRTSISLTTTGTSGAATYDNSTGVLNIPQYQGGVTSFNTRTGAVTLLSADVTGALGYTPVTNARTLSINGVSYDLSADRSWTIGPTIYSRGLQKFIATAGQTTFTITNGYTVGLVDVYRNGVKLDNATDFTATNGTTVVLTDAAALNDVIEVYKYGSEYIPNNALRTVNTFTATAAQTTFSATYSVGLLDVFYNGSKLAAAEYTATNGTSVVLGIACVAGDIVEIIAYTYLVNGYSGVSGSGNNNYIPKFTSTTSIGNSLIYDDGTYVGIGTAVNTTYKLQVNGTLAAGATTLSGALTGTSATFSTAVYSTGGFGSGISSLSSWGSSVVAPIIEGLAGNAIANYNGGGTTPEMYIVSNAYYNGTSWVRKQANAVAQLQLSGVNNKITLSGAATGAANSTFSFSDYLTINASTGAATFSNNVTIGQATAATNVKLILNGVVNKAAGIEFHQSGTAQWYIGNGIASEDNNFELYNSNGTMAMKIIKSTNAINFIGAATFSSTVATNGIVFPASQVASSDPNTLDDYEEGTSSPAASPAGGGAFTTVTQSGNYVKIGQVVHYSFIITINSVGTATGDVLITLPFVCNLSPIRPMGSGRENALTGNVLQIRTASDGSASALIIGGGTLANSWQALGTITYRTTA